MNKKPFLRSFPTPQQHGAWAMFLIPAFMAAFLAGKLRVSVGLLILSFVLIFLSHRPATRFIRRLNKRRGLDTHSLLWSVLLGGSGAILAGGLFIWSQQWVAFGFGLLVAFTFLGHTWLTMNREHMSVFGEIVGVFGLTSSAPIIYLFLHGSLDPRGWVLWMINFLYFTGAIFYVKLKLRIQPSMLEPDLKGKLRAGLPALLYCVLILTYVSIVTFARGYSWYFLWAYVPYVAKTISGVFRWQIRSDLNTTRFGLVELAHALLFWTLSTAGFQATIR